MAGTGNKALDPRKSLALDTIPVRLAYPVHEAAQLLGSGDRTLWRLVRSGRLAAVRLGSRVFIARATLEKYVSDNTDSTGTPVRRAPPHIRAAVAAAAARAVNA